MRSTIAFARPATSMALPLVVTIFLTIGSAGCGDGEPSTAPSPEKTTKPNTKTHAPQPLINKSDRQVSTAEPSQAKQARIRNRSTVRTEQPQPRSTVPGPSDQTAVQFKQALITALTGPTPVPLDWSCSPSNLTHTLAWA